jgi:hypothetical protein
LLWWCCCGVVGLRIFFEDPFHHLNKTPIP